MISGNNLKNALKAANITQEEAASKLKISRQTLNVWCQRDSLESYMIERIREDIGLLLLSDDIDLVELTGTKQQHNFVINNHNKGVPYYDLDATASIAETFSDINEKPEFYIDFKPFNDCIAYFPIFGDSMFPQYRSGEIVAVKSMMNLSALLWGEAYLVITSPEANNLRTIKLLFPHKDENKIILRSSNPNFSGDTVINREHIKAVYIIKGKISKNML